MLEYEVVRKNTTKRSFTTHNQNKGAWDMKKIFLLTVISLALLVVISSASSTSATEVYVDGIKANSMILKEFNGTIIIHLSFETSWIAKKVAGEIQTTSHLYIEHQGEKYPLKKAEAQWRGSHSFIGDSVIADYKRVDIFIAECEGADVIRAYYGKGDPNEEEIWKIVME